MHEKYPQLKKQANCSLLLNTRVRSNPLVDTMQSPFQRFCQNNGRTVDYHDPMPEISGKGCIDSTLLHFQTGNFAKCAWKMMLTVGIVLRKHLYCSSFVKFKLCMKDLLYALKISRLNVIYVKICWFTTSLWKYLNYLLENEFCCIPTKMVFTLGDFPNGD